LMNPIASIPIKSVLHLPMQMNCLLGSLLRMMDL
jgi:hypothetical protein